MRMPLNGKIIKEETFKTEYINGKNQGFSFKVQLAYYRGHYLSDIDKLKVIVDGVEVAQEAITFELNGKEMPIYKIKEAYTEYWSQVELAKINVIYPGGLKNGSHEIALELFLRIPYMELGPDHQFMPLDSSDKIEIYTEA